MKTEIEFTGLTIPINKLVKHNNINPPSPKSWIRVCFIVPDPFKSVELVEKWLYDNISSEWRSFTFNDPIKYDICHMVVKFKNHDDALIFKLSGGHQAFEILEK